MAEGHARRLAARLRDRHRIGIDGLDGADARLCRLGIGLVALEADEGALQAARDRAVVPVPKKGSSTLSPGRDEARITRCSSASGFWVGCTLPPSSFFSRSGPVQSGISQSLRICRSSLSAFMAA